MSDQQTDRLRALAREGAFSLHYTAVRAVHQATLDRFAAPKGTHTTPMFECQHPDCVLVRTPAASAVRESAPPAGLFLSREQIKQTMDALAGWGGGNDLARDDAHRRAAFEMIQEAGELWNRVSPEALVCPRCKQRTTERTSTNNGLCRACGNIFGRSDPVTFTQMELAALLPVESAEK